MIRSMPIEPPNSPWRAAVHESAHAVVCYANDGLVGGIRIHSGLYDCTTQLPPGDDLKHALITNGLIGLAGVVGERLYCGPLLHEDTQPDLIAFGRLVKDAWNGGWAVSTAKLAFSSIAEDLLRANEQMLFRLATFVKDHQHVYDSEVRRNLAESKRLFGLAASPLVGPGWEAYVEQTLQEWLRTQRRSQSRGNTPGHLIRGG